MAFISESELPRLLSAVDSGADLRSILGELVRTVESHQGSEQVMLGSILLLEGDRLVHGAAPSLPDAYNAAIDGIEIGPAVGSCGTAAYCGHDVFVVDIASDPLWKDFKDLALQHGLRACWSSPIVGASGGSSGNVLGTFALYYREQRSPNASERAVIREAAEAARALLERARRRSPSASTTNTTARSLPPNAIGDPAHDLEAGVGDTLGA